MNIERVSTATSKLLPTRLQLHRLQSTRSKQLEKSSLVSVSSVEVRSLSLEACSIRDVVSKDLRNKAPSVRLTRYVRFESEHRLFSAPNQPVSNTLRDPWQTNKDLLQAAESRMSGTLQGRYWQANEDLWLPTDMGEMWIEEFGRDVGERQNVFRGDVQYKPEPMPGTQNLGTGNCFCIQPGLPTVVFSGNYRCIFRM